MKRFVCVTTILVVLTALSFQFGMSEAADKKELSMKELMIKTHKGDNSPLMRVDKQLGLEQPAWSDVQADTKALKEVSDLMERKGVGGYRSTKEYVSSVKALTVAVEKKDRESAAKEFKRVKGTCAGCHKDGMP
ncbi:MAG: cytochrome c [Gemmataceae bacterium]|nr:cytochrome c [Gemmataceae bacterium]